VTGTKGTRLKHNLISSTEFAEFADAVYTDRPPASPRGKVGCPRERLPEKSNTVLSWLLGKFKELTRRIRDTSNWGL